MYVLPYHRNQLKYMHQTLFNPPIETIIKVVNNNQLKGFPFMKPTMVRKYLVPSPATSKGRMKRPRTGIRSTRTQVPHEETTELPSQQPPSPTEVMHQLPGPNIIINNSVANTSNVFCYATLADKVTGTYQPPPTSFCHQLRKMNYPYFGRDGTISET